MKRRDFWNKWGYGEVAKQVFELNRNDEDGEDDASQLAEMIIYELSVKEGWMNGESMFNMPEDMPWDEIKADVLTMQEYRQFAE